MRPCSLFPRLCESAIFETAARAPAPASSDIVAIPAVQRGVTQPGVLCPARARAWGVWPRRDVSNGEARASASKAEREGVFESECGGVQGRARRRMFLMHVPSAMQGPDGAYVRRPSRRPGAAPSLLLGRGSRTSRQPCCTPIMVICQFAQARARGKAFVYALLPRAPGYLYDRMSCTGRHAGLARRSA